MTKSFTIKSEDPGIIISDAVKYYASANYQGNYKGFTLMHGGLGSQTFSKSYWYAVKDDATYVDRGLTGLLEYIDKQSS